jgi:hypothetical protein
MRQQQLEVQVLRAAHSVGMGCAALRLMYGSLCPVFRFSPGVRKSLFAQLLVCGAVPPLGCQFFLLMPLLLLLLLLALSGR